MANQRTSVSASARPSLTAIARVAGTSLSTVSRVLKGGTDQARISPETAARIHQAALSLGWRDDLGERPPLVLGFGTSQVLSQLPWAQLPGIFHALRTADEPPVIISPMSDGLRQAWASGGIGRLVLLPGTTDGLALLAPRAGIMLAGWAGDCRLPAVVADRRSTAEVVAQVALRRGYRHLRLITGAPHGAMALALRAAAATAGLDLTTDPDAASAWWVLDEDQRWQPDGAGSAGRPLVALGAGAWDAPEPIDRVAPTATALAQALLTDDPRPLVPVFHPAP